MMKTWLKGKLTSYRDTSSQRTDTSRVVDDSHHDDLQVATSMWDSDFDLVCWGTMIVWIHVADELLFYYRLSGGIDRAHGSGAGLLCS
jgi:hypothetical protein